MYANLAALRVSLGRVSQILDEPIEVEERPEATALPAVTGDIEFDNVAVSFDRGAPVLEHFSLAIRAGETVAIVGPSGSGKSTVADLLLRLVDPDGGAVRIDGHDLRDVRLADLRRHVALVDQEPTILHATIAENIRYARPDAPDAEVVEAARQAAIDRFVDVLPEKYATVVGERGMALSAGERQRIAVARALIANPAVLILDEPSSALDEITERRLVDGYRGVMRGRTTIVITHRRDVARRADRVIAIEDGRVVEERRLEESQSA
jgi:ABC-type multidrug transport system fused ATPase/permease subunit